MNTTEYDFEFAQPVELSADDIEGFDAPRNPIFYDNEDEDEDTDTPEVEPEHRTPSLSDFIKDIPIKTPIHDVDSFFDDDNDEPEPLPEPIVTISSKPVTSYLTHYARTQDVDTTVVFELLPHLKQSITTPIYEAVQSELRKIDYKKRQPYKRKNIANFSCAVFEGTRKDINVKAVYAAQLDFDEIDDTVSLKEQLRGYGTVIFTSCSGKGVKLLKVYSKPLTAEAHRHVWDKLSKEFNNITGIVPDKGTRPPSTACYYGYDNNGIIDDTVICDVESYLFDFKGNSYADDINVKTSEPVYEVKDKIKRHGAKEWAKAEFDVITSPAMCATSGNAVGIFILLKTFVPFDTADEKAAIKKSKDKKIAYNRKHKEFSVSQYKLLELSPIKDRGAMRAAINSLHDVGFIDIVKAGIHRDSGGVSSTYKLSDRWKKWNTSEFVKLINPNIETYKRKKESIKKKSMVAE